MTNKAILEASQIADDSLAQSAIRQKPLQVAAKRLLDIIGGLFAILLLSPVLVGVALLVKLQDRGPIIHRRRVVGTKGEFDAFKFRSMCVDADAMLAADPELRRAFEQNFKLTRDPRITAVGAWLREFSLDELPQLFNVLRGEMSLVGPRMITAPELDKYGKLRELLLTVKPGLTGYWQVNGRQTVSYHTRVDMDMFYIRNWSFLLDLKILLQTPAAVLKGEGAC